jgi:hypothetical protein
MLSPENDLSRTNIPNTRSHRVGGLDSLLATTYRSRCGIVPIGLRSSYPLDLPWRLPFLGVALGVRREAPGCEVGARRHWLRGERDGGYPSLKRAVTRALIRAA